MFRDEKFKFKESVSSEAFTDKIITNAMIGKTSDAENRRIRKEYGYKANRGIGFIEGTFTPQELLDKLTEGHVICHLFDPLRRRKDGTFGSYEKTNENFKGSYVIGVDIDGTKYSTAEDYIEVLEFKPTFYYTSYRNLQDGMGARFRMIYVFNEPVRDRYHFRYFAWLLHQKIESDTKEKIKDKCGLNCTQYFNGTNRKKDDIIFSCGITNYIYEFSDFSPTIGGFLSFLNHNCYYKKSLSKEEKWDIEFLKGNLSTTNTNTTYYNEWQKNEHSLFEAKKVKENKEYKKNVRCSDRLVSDMSRLDYDEFMKYNRHKFCYFYRVEREEWVVVNDKVKYQDIDDGYFSLYYNAKSIHDGQKRRKKLYQRMCLRRVMKPDVDADTLLFNAYEDLHRFCDNDPTTVDNVITIDELVRNVKSAMGKEIYEIEDELSEQIEELKSRKPKYGRIYKFNGRSDIRERNSMIKEANWSLISENYDCSISVKQNNEFMKEQNIRCSVRTLYRFCKEYDIDPKGINDDIGMMRHYDNSLTLRQNLTMLKDMGYKISLGKLSKLIHNKR